MALRYLLKSSGCTAMDAGGKLEVAAPSEVFGVSPMVN
jgi:hypothetical protein